MVEYDLRSPTFWTMIVLAFCTWIPWLNQQFGLSIIVPTSQMMDALVALIVGLLVIEKAFVSRNPVIIRGEKK